MRVEEKNIHKSAYATKERQYRYRSCTIGLLNWYGWGVNAKNTLYHVLAKTHVIPQVLRVRAKVPGPPYLLHDAWQ